MTLGSIQTSCRARRMHCDSVEGGTIRHCRERSVAGSNLLLKQVGWMEEARSAARSVPLAAGLMTCRRAGGRLAMEWLHSAGCAPTAAG